MLRLYVNSKILLGLFATILIILILGVTSYWYMQQVLQVSHKGSQSQSLILCLERTRSLFAKMEAVALDKPIDENSKESVDTLGRLLPLLEERIAEVTTLTSFSDSAQQNRATRLSKITREKIRDILEASTIKGSIVNNEHSSKSRAPEDIVELENLIDEMQEAENILRIDRATQVTRQFSRFSFSFFGLLVSGMIILTFLIYALNRNMKARLNAENKLKEVLASVHDLYENAPCGYFSINKDGMFTGINQTLLEWIGYRREKVVHHFHIREVFSNDINVLYDGYANELIEKGFLKDIESTIVCEDKSTFPVIINAVALIDQKGEHIGTRCSLFDNTERKAAENNAIKLTNELEAFTYSVSHDLRAPLRSIKGYAQILKEDYVDSLGGEASDVLDRVLTNAGRMNNLIEDLLNFSYSKRKSIAKEATNMTEFATQVMNELLENEKHRTIEFTVEDLGFALADRSMLRQVWVNLFSNALKYSRVRTITTIEVKSEEKANEVIYSIKDNGVGFDMKYYNKLFGVFSRLHKQDEFEGTGVGLALVQRIVERHNGRVWAKAKLNEGATFFFSIAKNPGN